MDIHPNLTKPGNEEYYDANFKPVFAENSNGKLVFSNLPRYDKLVGFRIPQSTETCVKVYFETAGYSYSLSRVDLPLLMPVDNEETFQDLKKKVIKVVR